ncbi:MAG: hypothetical protein U9Q21_03905 [Candidatus Auribacterota bacterium]|nr:hypothetical protein [Candidatus Auribacterota bacterium]
MGINITKEFYFPCSYTKEIKQMILLLAVLLAIGAIAVHTTSEEGLPAIEPGKQYLVSEIMERDNGICMFPFIFVGGLNSPYNEPPTALVGDIKLHQTENAMSFTAVALRPLTVKITLYDSEGEICGETTSRYLPFPEETGETFFGSKKAVFLNAGIPLNKINKKAEKISVSYVEDRTKSHPSLFLFYHTFLKTQSSNFNP